MSKKYYYHFRKYLNTFSGNLQNYVKHEETSKLKGLKIDMPPATRSHAGIVSCGAEAGVDVRPTSILPLRPSLPPCRAGRRDICALHLRREGQGGERAPPASSGPTHFGGEFSLTHPTWATQHTPNLASLPPQHPNEIVLLARPNLGR